MMPAQPFQFFCKFLAYEEDEMLLAHAEKQKQIHKN